MAGEPSVRTSRLGMASPTFTKAERVEWKPLEVAEARPDRAVKVKGRRLDLNAIFTEGWTNFSVRVTKELISKALLLENVKPSMSSEVRSA